MGRRAWISFAAMSAIWGMPYLLIKIAVTHGASPVFVAWSRLTLAAAVLVALAWRAGTLSSLRGRWRWLLAYAIVEVGLPFPLIGVGEQHVPSSLAAIVIATVPLISAVIAVRYDRAERPTRSRVAGLLIGFAGVVVLVGLDVVSSTSELLGTLAIFAAAIGYSIGPLIIKHRLGDLDARATMGVSLGIAAALLTPLAALDPPRGAPSTAALGAIVVLGLLCTAAAFVIFSVLIREAGPSRALVITYVNPAVAVLLGFAVLGERPTSAAVAGLLLILAGSWLATGGRTPPGLGIPVIRRRRERRRGAVVSDSLAETVASACARAGAVRPRLEPAPCKGC